ncbi:transient receptor potential cation channel subfamily A member 1-like [Montipora foliosa]|uniref:transient receptor potential cation channel subfamily A member 1-like n=1 Tax=Montipora foliosa TaxID=591990 RepID=UPI0035F1211C
MAKKRDEYLVIPVEEKEMENRRSPSDSTDRADDDIEVKFNKDFWLKVQNKVKSEKLPWSRAMDEVRADCLIEKYGKNVLLVIIHQWPQKYKEKPEVLPSLEYLISRLTEIILKRDTKEDYKYFQVDSKDDATCPTLLHLAAGQNFLHVSKALVERYPGLMYLYSTEHEDKPSYLPVELALKKYNDDTAAYLISQMRHDRIQKLFLCKEDDEQTPTKFYFGDYVSYRDEETNEPNMKKTVLAVLDKHINPRWPYLPERKGDDENDSELERAFSSVPDDPMNYDFFYHILEADDHGRQPKLEVATEVDESGAPVNTEMKANPKFNPKSLSCLRRIAESGNKEAIQHPVVRMLVSRKWNKFAHRWFCVQAAFYVLFLTVLSFALIHGATQDDPTQYSGKANGLRLFCEVLSIIFLMFYFFEEVNQAEREWHTYFKDPYNYFDWLGLILTFLVIPLRFVEVDSQWSVAGLGYLFNFLRLFKFSCVTRTTGLYSKTLAKIIYRDMSRFCVVFVIVCLGFCGSMYMALKATGSQENFSNYAWLMLAAVRALAEQQPVEEDYSKFRWLAILILLSYMVMVIVILLNILIAQMSYTYSEAKRTAKLQYAIDTMRIATRLEYSRFARWNLRVNSYKDGDWISEKELAKEMLEYSDDSHPWETMEEKLTNIRNLMRKVVKREKETDPLESIDDKLANITKIVEEIPLPPGIHDK